MGGLRLFIPTSTAILVVMSVPRVEKAYEKHAWILLFVFGILWLIYGFYLFIGTPEASIGFESRTGIAWSELVASSPRVAEAVTYIIRFAGIMVVVLGIFVIAVSLKSYRRGERWAWYTFWTLPVFPGIDLALEVSGGVGSVALLWDGPLLIIPLLGLLLPIRKFFPRKQV